eukprot:gb/GECG01011547.1/.p1 GENE.gb/GECG01011547.1/~~gb/GECG01011547.1/.p1  ORF type:complete len:136 (+),score=14.75 gb/GECG01011547.1/:1-408(+)
MTHEPGNKKAHDYLRHDDGFALQAICMCQAYLEDFHIPPHELEVDVRGRIEWDGTTLHVAIGEIKSSASERAFNEAVLQLKKRFRVLAIAAKVIFGDSIHTLEGTGKVHVPAKCPTPLPCVNPEPKTLCELEIDH